MCTLTQGFSIGCNDAAGGIIEFIIGNFETMGAITKGGTNGEVDTIAGSAFAFKYVPEKATSSMNDNPQVDRVNGTRFFQHQTLIVLNKLEQVKRNEIKLLSEALLMIIGKDKQGKFWMMGADTGSRMANGDSGTGVAMGDRNGYNLNFEAEEIEPLIEVESSIIAALLAP